MPLPVLSDHTDWKGKRVIVRADFNVPLKDGKILDDYKIIQTLPTLRYLVKRGASIILVSHLGRPEGKIKRALSLRPIARELEKKLRRKILFLDQYRSSATWSKIKSRLDRLPAGSVTLLENIRFSALEDDPASSLAKDLASCADIFVLDGFGVSHRQAASVTGITKYLPSFAGLLLEKEVMGLQQVMKKPALPLVLVIGGAKADTKIPIIKQFARRANVILLGGALVSEYLAACGHAVGVFKANQALGKMLMQAIKKAHVILPRDVVIGTPDGKRVEILKITENFSLVDTERAIYDVGPLTIKEFEKNIAKARTVIWNGALGFFEKKSYSSGTFALARAVGAATRNQGAFTVAGGGETVEILRHLKLLSSYSLVSTGGGAMLEFLSGTSLAGVAALTS
jgi:phosphoglycerate kinase